MSQPTTPLFMFYNRNVKFKNNFGGLKYTEMQILFLRSVKKTQDFFISYNNTLRAGLWQVVKKIKDIYATV